MNEQNVETAEKTKIKNPALKLIADTLVTYGIALLLMGGGAVAFGFIPMMIFSLLKLDMNEHPVLATAEPYINFGGIWIVILIFIRCNKDKEYTKKILGKIAKKTWLMLIIGFIITGGLNAACIASALLHKDIFLYFNEFSILPLILLLVSVFVQSSAEELVCRGFIYRRMESKYDNPLVPILVNALFFSLLHLTNSGVTLLSLFNILLSGIYFSLIIYYTDSMAFAFAGHTGWNFCQSIIFGLPNSGSVFPYSIMKLEASNARDSFFYNCGFGVEGTVFSVILLVLACAVLFALGQKGVIGKKA